MASAVAYLKGRDDLDTGKIGLIGHSEGGLLAPKVAAGSDEIAFMVLLAGPGIPGYDILMLQTELIQRASGVSGPQLEVAMQDLKGALDIMKETEDTAALSGKLSDYLKGKIESRPDMVPDGMDPKAVLDAQVKRLATPWMHYFITYDPAPALRKVTCPVLALNGEKDLQVPAEVNLKAIERWLKEGGNTAITTKVLPGLNHLFQTSETGAPSEYGTLEETFSPAALQEISVWIKGQTQ